jgi:hypothetical protein
MLCCIANHVEDALRGRPILGDLTLRTWCLASCFLRMRSPIRDNNFGTKHPGNQHGLQSIFDAYTICLPATH